jgi:hypothetical protein
VYSNVLSGPPSAPAPQQTQQVSVPAAEPAAPEAAAPRPAPSAAAVTAPRASAARGQRGDEFHPVLRSKRPEDRVDPLTVDPTLRTDLLAKVQEMKPSAGERNPFQFGAAAPKPAAVLKGPEPIVKVKKFMGPVYMAERKTDPAAAPPPPPINVKYYGLVSPVREAGRRTAFFLDGDDILIKAEGDTVKGHYKVVRIGATSVVVEDTQSKRQQTIPLAEEAQS